MVGGARVELGGVHFRYGEREVLHGLQLALAAGEVVALLGRNGSGKSTLLKLVAGTLRPARGSVRLDGTDLAGIAPRDRARRIAMVPQALNVPFSFTLRELVALGRTPYLTALGGERQEDREAVERAMAQAEVSELADRLVGETSGGEQQRAALAMALAQEPALLLLDEPTSHLDLHHQQNLLGLVRRLNRSAGVTVLAAMHDVNLAALWFDRLLLLRDGRIAADGSPDEVLRPDLLEQVFGSPVHVLRHPTENVPLVALSRPADTDSPQRHRGTEEKDGTARSAG